MTVELPVQLHVVGANLFAGNPDVHAALEDLLWPHDGHVPDVAILCEANNAWRQIRRAARRHGYKARRAGRWSKGAREIVILTRKGVVHVLEAQAEKVADGLDSRIAPARYLLRLRCRKHGQQFTAYGTHHHASLQSPNGRVTTAPGSHERVAQAKGQTARIVELFGVDRAAGFPPVIFEDSNITAHPDGPSFAPSKAYPAAGVAWESKAVDGIGHDTHAFTSTGFTDFPVAGTDHRGGSAGLRTTLTFKEHR